MVGGFIGGLELFNTKIYLNADSFLYFCRKFMFNLIFGIMKKVNFKSVVHAVRFDLLGSLLTPTPAEFVILDEAEKLALYRSLFDVIHDSCTLLSSALDTEKLLSKYNVE